MKFRLRILFSALALGISLIYLCHADANKSPRANQELIVSPYVQLGPTGEESRLSIVFGVNAKVDGWSCEYKSGKDLQYKSATVDEKQLNGSPDIKLVCAHLDGLATDSEINYQVSLKGKPIFVGTTSRPGQNATCRFAVIGDCGFGSNGEKQIGLRLGNKKPMMTVIPGDIVYPIGTIRNYLKNFFPYFNGGQATGLPGEALMKSCLFVACPGNHDIAMGGFVDARDLDTFPDSMAYFSFWKQPHNGPLTQAGSNVPLIYGSQKNKEEFLQSAGASYPRMANFSYDWGDSHWLILDGNKYVDWQNNTLRAWVDKDLASSKRAWKFVVMHQPGFSSDWHHREEQQMRLLADLFEKNKVDIVFSGHSHSYQRSYPLRFKISGHDLLNPDREAKAGFVYGSFALDKSFDGTKNTKPNGVIYIVSGAGGAQLSLPELEEDPTRLQPFTAKFACKKHSFTLCQMTSSQLSLEQVGADGSTIDKIMVSK